MMSLCAQTYMQGEKALYSFQLNDLMADFGFLSGKLTSGPAVKAGGS